MRIGLFNLEPEYHNTALMEISEYHKRQGDEVELYLPISSESYDRVYASSIFTFTDKSWVTSEMIVGGTGFDVKSALPPEIASCTLDYDLYPDCRTSYLWYSRGCIRRCPFCVIGEKEGGIRAVDRKNLNPRAETVTVMDNNFFASPGWRDAVKDLLEIGLPVRITQGIDVRILDEDKIDALARLKHVGSPARIYFAWDNPRDDLIPAIKALTKKIRAYRLTCYVLIGYWSTPEEDQARVEALRALGVDPYVMPYDKRDDYQRSYSRYVNNRYIFKTVAWSDYDVNKRWRKRK